MFYDDPYAWIDEACESIERLDQSRAQSQALVAIAIILLSMVEEPDEDDPIMEFSGE